MSEHPADFVRSVERGARTAVGGVITVQSAVYLLAEFGGPHALPATVVAAIGLLVALRCWTGRVSVLDVGLTEAALLVGYATTGPQAAPGAVDSPLHLLIDPLLVSLLVLDRRRVVTVAAATVAVYVPLRAARSGVPDGWWYGLQESVYVVGSVAAAGILLRALRHAARRAATEVAAAAARTDALEGEAASRLDATAFAHDELVPALVGLSLRPDHPDARRVASLAAARMQHHGTAPDSSRTLGALLDRVCTGTPLRIEIGVSPRSRRVRLEGALSTALDGALREALRNVHQHAGTTHVMLRGRATAGRGRLQVRDFGVGFDATRSHGVGLTTSVESRLGAVGGRSTVVSAPGEGTEVTLRWSRQRAARWWAAERAADHLVRAAVGNPAPIVVAAAGALVAGYVFCGLLALARGDVPIPAFLAALAMTPILLATGAAISRGPLSLAWILVPAWAPAPLILLGLQSLSPEHIADINSSVIDAAAAAAAPAAFVLPFRIALLIPLPHAMAILAAAWGQGLSPAELVGSMLAPYFIVLFVAALAHVFRRAGRAVASAQSDLNAHRERGFTAALDAALGPLRPEVEALLGDAAETRSPAETAALALRLAHGVRDGLYLHDTAHRRLRHAMDASRRAGHRVELHARDVATDSTPLSVALEQLVASAITARAITVTLSNSRTLTVIPGLTPTEVTQLATSPGVVVGDAESTLLRW